VSGAGAGVADLPILEAVDVRKIYHSEAGEVSALEGIDLRVKEGELVAVMGPSGSGKTTLLNCLSGLDDVDSGKVLYRGDDIHGLSDARRASFRSSGMGFVFQAFHLIPVFSALENVEIPLVLSGVPPREARRRAAEMLDQVGLGERGDRRPAELAGGEQQRVAIARALVGRPAIVWADEPTGNLDTRSAIEVLDLLHQAHGQGQTVILVTHERAIGEACPRLLKMRDGRIESDDAPLG
jgi:putative ABC transport system ATP-binding protein